jgi:hypothetical protein
VRGKYFTNWRDFLACNLQNDPGGTLLLLAKVGSSATLFVDSDSGNAAIESAQFNDVAVAADANGKLAIGPFVAGINILLMTIDDLEPDSVRLKEDCGGGASQVLKTFDFDENEPAHEYKIFAQ